MAYTTIDKSSLHFSPTLYVGNGGTKTVTGVPFEPDMSWLKNRSATGDHEIYDKVRGVGYRIYPNANAGHDDLGSQGLSAWTSDGFTVGNNTAINGNGNNQVSWNWKANGAGSSNTDGSITSTVSVNTTSKCSIVTYTGNDSNSTVGHGLGTVPTSIWIKQLNGSNDWRVYHKSLGATHYLALNTQAGDNSGGEVIWNDTLPTSSVFSIGTNGTVNGGSDTYVAYCFAEVQGFSKIDRYFGNGNANGAFIYTGFKPAWIMIKRTDAANDEWFIWDSKRLGYNGGNNNLFADTTDVESTVTANAFDILSNGFKLRTTDTALNGSNNSYTYWSFAEAPLVGSNNVPATAR